jgi:hypothetical protein
MGIWYTTRESVKSALDSAETARNNVQVDRAIESASRSLEGLLHRRFYPQTATRYFAWPNRQYARSWRLWLDQDEVASVSTLVAGGVTIPATDYFLEPANSGPPYTRVEVDLGSSSAFSSSGTHQRAIAITGVFIGCPVDEEPAGALAALISSTSATTCNVTDSSLIGVGDIIKVDSERMLVTGKSMLDTAQNVSNLTAANSDVAITGITAGTIAVGEIILVDSERMLAVDVAGTTVTVKRAWDGSVLAAHSSPTDIFAGRTLTVTRGALGTTAATHSNGAAITKHVVPGLVKELCVAEAINTIQQETSGYAREVGEGENAREASGRGLREIRNDALAAYGRKARSAAV